MLAIRMQVKQVVENIKPRSAQPVEPKPRQRADHRLDRQIVRKRQRQK